MCEIGEGYDGSGFLGDDNFFVSWVAMESLLLSGEAADGITANSKSVTILTFNVLCGVRSRC